MLACIPTVDDAGRAARVHEHFGSAPFFTLYGSDSDVAVTDPNGGALSPDAITGWGSDTLSIGFSTPLTLDGELEIQSMSPRQLVISFSDGNVTVNSIYERVE